jgi:hypothetical protein
MKVEEIAQYVIDNRFSKSENDKVTDSELYHFLVDSINELSTQPTTETLQEGDWTKCEKFSEWVALWEIESNFYGAEDCYNEYFNQFDGCIKFLPKTITYGDLIWGKGENFLPYQEFKSRAENTFKKTVEDKVTFRNCPNCNHENTKQESLNAYTCRYCEGESDTEF